MAAVHRVPHTSPHMSLAKHPPDFLREYPHDSRLECPLDSPQVFPHDSQLDFPLDFQPISRRGSPRGGEQQTNQSKKLPAIPPAIQKIQNRATGEKGKQERQKSPPGQHFSTYGVLPAQNQNHERVTNQGHRLNGETNAEVHSYVAGSDNLPKYIRC